VRVEKLVLDNFRNYAREEIVLAPGLNLVVGRNAQGKTNLLEAIHCLSGLGSPRAENAALVRQGQEAAVIHAEVTRGRRTVQVDLEIKPGRGTRALVNKTPVPRTSALTEVIVTVFFGPDELSLVKGSPDGRRRFLDELVVKLRPARDALRRELERVVRQRSALLKSLPKGGDLASARDALEVWDAALCRAGAAQAAARLETLRDLLPHAAKRYEEIAGAGRLELAYVSSWLPEDHAAAIVIGGAPIDDSELQAHLARRVEELRRAEVERGATLVGPQRDDVSVKLASRGDEPGSMLDARSFASQGDQRTSALALKLAEHDLLSASLGDEPILLLDDVFSELDPHRRSWLSDAVRDVGQTIVTSAEPLALESLRPEKLIEVKDGATYEPA
jgi:DNA replication and repair protein RecF